MASEHIDGMYRVVTHENGVVERLLITEPVVEPDPPLSLSSARALIALEQAGLLDDLEAWIATQPRTTQIAFERAQEFRSDSPLLVAGATALGLTEGQLRALFVSGKAVVI